MRRLGGLRLAIILRVRDTGPKWARWSGPAAERPWTVGIEEHPGYERQRAYAASHGLDVLSERPAADFAVPGLLTVAARAGSEVAR